MGQRTIVVGDIHGCYGEFLDLLAKCQYQEGKDQLISVGDLIHRGPDSLSVLKYFSEHPCRAVLGNHELGLVRVMDGEFHHPAFEQIISEMGTEADDWKNWIENLPTFLEFDDFIVVHAGLHPEKHPRETDRNILIHIRTWDGQGEDLNNQGVDPPWYELYKGEKLVIYGHWASQGLNIRKNTIGLDSGCVYGRELTAVILPERKIVQVPARDVYFRVNG